MYKLVVSALVFLLSGCSQSIVDTNKDDFIIGCKVVRASANLGYLSQSGSVEACKLVCSKSIPKTLVYSYESPGCKINIGVKPE